MARNTEFRFKQFTIRQDRCTMKVCTDACVFGAWADVTGAKRILDIGAGTGLLSLMAAQRNPHAWIDAVEIDEAAALQAVENVKGSPFAEQIRIIPRAVQDHKPDHLYDTILTNPPFFQADLRSPDAGINKAHHAQTLAFPELLDAVSRLLQDRGIWQVLLPPAESEQMVKKASQAGWNTTRQLVLYHTFSHKALRVLTAFGRNVPDTYQPQVEKLAIYENDGKTYTVAFRKLLQEFYLIF